jgi:hypothetical protein
VHQSATQPAPAQNVAVKKPGFLESASVPIQNFGKNPVSKSLVLMLSYALVQPHQNNETPFKSLCSPIVDEYLSVLGRSGSVAAIVTLFQ